MGSIIPKEPAARIAALLFSILTGVSGMAVERYSGKPIDQTVLEIAVARALAQDKSVERREQRITDAEARLTALEKMLAERLATMAADISALAKAEKRRTDKEDRVDVVREIDR